MEGNEVGTLELSDAVFGVEVNEHLVHMAVVRQLANKRQGTQKAKVFGDEEVRNQILTETDQMTIKKLGRLVKNYDDSVWTERRFQIVVDGNLAKFSQNDDLRRFLLGTGNKIIVEASPKDRIWGIGFDEFAPEATNPALWNGENLLGFALMEVRDRLRGIGTQG